MEVISKLTENYQLLVVFAVPLFFSGLLVALIEAELRSDNKRYNIKKGIQKRKKK